METCLSEFGSGFQSLRPSLEHVFQLNPDHPLRINPPSPQHGQSLTSFEHLLLVTCCPSCRTIAHQQYLQPKSCADAPPNSKTAASFKSCSAVSELLWVCDINYLSPESQQGLCKAGALLSEGFPGFRDIFCKLAAGNSGCVQSLLHGSGRQTQVSSNKTKH